MLGLRLVLPPGCLSGRESRHEQQHVSLDLQPKHVEMGREEADGDPGARAGWVGRCKSGPSFGREEGGGEAGAPPLLQGLPRPPPRPPSTVIPASQTVPFVRAPVPPPHLVCCRQLATDGAGSSAAAGSYLQCSQKPQALREGGHFA